MESMVLLQERYEPEPWSILVSSLCLKKTRRDQTESVVERLLDQYPTPTALDRGDRADLEAVLEPVGLWRQRADELERVAQYLSERGPPESRNDALDLYGVGESVADSYAIFALDDRSVDPSDEKLRDYLDE